MRNLLERAKARAWAFYAEASAAKADKPSSAAGAAAALAIIALSSPVHAGFLDGLGTWLKTEVIDSSIWPTALFALFVYEIFMWGMEKKVQYIAKAVMAAIACSAWVGRDAIWEKLANSKLGV